MTWTGTRCHRHYPRCTRPSGCSPKPPTCGPAPPGLGRSPPTRRPSPCSARALTCHPPSSPMRLAAPSTILTSTIGPARQWAACLELLARFDPESIEHLSLSPIDIGAIRERHGGPAAASIVARLAGLRSGCGADLGLGRAAADLAADLDQIDLPPHKGTEFLAAAAHLPARGGAVVQRARGTARPDLPAQRTTRWRRHHRPPVRAAARPRRARHYGNPILEEKLQIARAATAWCAGDPARVVADFMLAITALETATDLDDPSQACEAAAEAATAYLDMGHHAESQVAVKPWRRRLVTSGRRRRRGAAAGL